ncbi:MAG TPA: hypothetical protein VIG77_09420 [Ktedonobacterales bacterium]|jgi:hypothetical protein
MTSTHITQTREREDAQRTPERSFFARLPAYTWVGLALNLLAWASSWGRLGFWWPYTFFPLWLGFILTLDGLNVAVSGTSPLKRSKARFVALFLFSSPFWWVFEGLNVPVQNWRYYYDHHYSFASNFFWTSLDFSTVLPAVMELVELVAAIPGLRPRLGPKEIGQRLPLGVALALFAAGVAMVVLPFIYPQRAFGLVWLCLIFLLDPINNLLRRKSASAHLLARDWRFFVTLPLATIICGFFWEMWNSQALPGWKYTVPYINAPPYLFGGPVPHLFEMPLIGYTGYLPFGIELFVMYQFALLLLRMRRDNLAV